MSGDAYDPPLSALRTRVEDLAMALAVWSYRSEPDAHARRSASDAVDAIDAMLRELHGIRGQLVGEIRASDDANAARADAMLSHMGARPGTGRRPKIICVPRGRDGDMP